MAVVGKDLVIYVNPELQRLRALVDAARARLAEFGSGLHDRKGEVEAMKARLFARLRAHFQRRDRGLLESQADELAKEIEELTGEAAPRIE